MSDRKKIYILTTFTIGFSIIYLLVGRGKILAPSALVSNNFIITGLRLPRVIMAISAGGLLAVCGYILQRMTNNPIVSPDIIGVSSGSSFGIILFYWLYMDSNSNSVANLTMLPLFSVFGSLIVICFLTFIFRKSKSAYQIILFGLAITSLFSALSNLLIADGQVGLANEVAKYQIGSLAGVNLQQSLITMVITLVVLSIIFINIKYITILVIDDHKLKTLGLNINLINLMTLIGIALAITLVVTNVGVVSFIGIIAPHINRRFNFKTVKHQLFGCFLVGGLTFLFADYLATNLFYPIIIPGGVITAIVGIPLFITIIYFERKQNVN